MQCASPLPAVFLEAEKYGPNSKEETFEVGTPFAGGTAGSSRTKGFGRKGRGSSRMSRTCHATPVRRTLGHPDRPQTLDFHEALYWATITLTTVGYGDYSPSWWLTQAAVRGAHAMALRWWVDCCGGAPLLCSRRLTPATLASVLIGRWVGWPPQLARTPAQAATRWNAPC